MSYNFISRLHLIFRSLRHKRDRKILYRHLRRSWLFFITPFSQSLKLRGGGRCPYLNSVDRNKRILEIGPLNRPLIPRENGNKNVFYADMRSTTDVKDFYNNDPNVDCSLIVDIDFVVTDSYQKSFIGVEKFDYIIASHVIEHIPQLLRFFRDIAEILNHAGKICLTIPDGRYCFDHYRYPTSFAECYDLYTRGVNNNPMRFLDGALSYTKNDAAFWWSNRSDYLNLPTDIDAGYAAVEQYRAALTGKYVDAHFSVFTPESFLLLLYNMTKLSLFPFRLVEFFPTRPNTFEFDVVLELSKDLLQKKSSIKQEILDNLLSQLSQIAINEEHERFVRRESGYKFNLTVGEIREFEILTDAR
ncbi:hypothetical protein AGMMS49959_15860 [Planctomycetales bacterium]|nr:hypothetical protein AGMMS49959_15710 [Planctomycetales bacterium]GHV23277.1 hypothetical protein AGMMS49959_15860 [Planctomycetales bacterium]